MVQHIGAVELRQTDREVERQRARNIRKAATTKTKKKAGIHERERDREKEREEKEIPRERERDIHTHRCLSHVSESNKGERVPWTRKSRANKRGFSGPAEGVIT